MRTLIKEKSFDNDVKEAFLDFVKEDGLNFRDASSMVAQIYNIAFDEVVDMLNGMGIREDSDTKKVVIDEADDKKDSDKKDDKDKDDKDMDDKDKKDSDKKDDKDPDKKDDKKKDEATAANTDKVDDKEKEKEKAKQKADDKKKDDDRKADAKKDEIVITVEEDTPIPGTDIILEKGDKIILVSEKKN